MLPSWRMLPLWSKRLAWLMKAPAALVQLAMLLLGLWLARAGDGRIRASLHTSRLTHYKSVIPDLLTFARLLPIKSAISDFY